MYDIEKRKHLKFATAKDIIDILSEVPADTQVIICGDDYIWAHFEEDGSVVNLDNEDLEAVYNDEEE